MKTHKRKLPVLILLAIFCFTLLHLTACKDGKQPDNPDQPGVSQTDYGIDNVYYAKEVLGADSIVFYGITGGRVDHVLCNLAIMRLAHTLGMSAKAEEDGLDIHYVEGKFDLPTQKGETISILPYGENALVSDSQNLEYPLDELILTSCDSRGLSNVSLGGKIHINVKRGGVFVFRYIKR